MNFALTALALVVGATASVAQEQLRGPSSVVGRLLKGDAVPAETDPLFFCVNQANHVRGVAASAAGCDLFVGGSDPQEKITAFGIETTSGTPLGTLLADVAKLRADVDSNDADIDRLGDSIDGNDVNIFQLRNDVESIRDAIESSVEDNMLDIETLFRGTGIILNPGGNFVGDSLQTQVESIEIGVVALQRNIDDNFEDIETLFQATGNLNPAGKLVGDSLQTQIDDIKAAISTISSSITDLSNRVDDNEDAISNVSFRTTDIENGLWNAQSALATAQDAIVTLSTDTSALDSEVDELKTNQTDLQDKVDEIDLDIGILAGFVNELKQCNPSNVPQCDAIVPP